MIYDATYTEAEYIVHAGWGTQHGRKRCASRNKASVRKLVLFHHDPTHTDAILDAIAQELETAKANAVIGTRGNGYIALVRRAFTARLAS